MKKVIEGGVNEVDSMNRLRVEAEKKLAKASAKIDYLLSKTECSFCPEIMACDNREHSPSRPARGSRQCLDIQNKWLTKETIEDK